MAENAKGPPDEQLEGWLCDCGAWEDTDLHCVECGREPPWGCDCDACQGDGDDDDWDDCSDDWCDEFLDEDFYP